MRALIVDKRPLARRRVRALLKAEPDIKVAAECCDGPGAATAIRRRRPDLVFLNVAVPIQECFGVLETVRAERLPAIILVTRIDNDAVRASELHSLDSLLGAGDDRCFQEAVAHARAQVMSLKSLDAAGRAEWPAENSQGRSKRLERLAIKSAGRVHVLRTTEIDWFESAGNYVRLHIGKNMHLMRETLASLEAELDPSQFLRIHRSTIVNIERIRELEPSFNGDSVITLSDRTELVVSRTYRPKLRGILGGSL